MTSPTPPTDPENARSVAGSATSSDRPAFDPAVPTPAPTPAPTRAPSGTIPPTAPSQPTRTRARRRPRSLTAAAQDDLKVRHAAMSVGVAVAAVSGSVILIGCVVLIVLSVTNAVQLPSEMEPNIDLERGRITFTPRPPRWGWLNADQFIWAVAILALVSLITTPIVAWVMARRAVKPMAEALRLQRHFVADASHELRTPLTALSSRVQILQRRLDSGKPIDDVARSLHADTTNMARVLDDMLLTVEGAPLVEGTRTSVVECLRQAITSLSPMAEQCDVTLTCQAASDMFVAAPETSLTRAVVAIVDNAIQHSPAGSRVDLSAETVDRTVIIRVRDQGPGIAGVDPSQVFDRFAHGSETGRKRSFGLGLALASEVAHRYGGDIRVESTSSEGTTFAASFPRV